MFDLSIIVPVFNEAGNIKELIKRINVTMKRAGIKYQLIFIDDHSVDETSLEVKKWGGKLPVELYSKKGQKGKAFSILEGVKYSKSGYIAMIDGDLQYPPEAIAPMYMLAKEHGVAVANRKTTVHESSLRKIGSKINSFVFGKLIGGFNCDVQSGLKVFKKEIIDFLNFEDVTRWTLDMPLLITAQELGYEIKSYDIIFEKRREGKSKINFLKASSEIATEALKLKFKKRKIYKIKSTNLDSMIGAGVIHRKKHFITHTTLDHKKSALTTFSNWQKILIFSLFVGFLTGLSLNAWLTLVICVAIFSLIYFIDMCFNLYVLFQSLHKFPELKFSESDFEKIDEKDLPVYSILCPLYKESQVLPHFIESIQSLDWPKEKLDVLLLLEENDKETIDAARDINLPNYIKIVVVPHSFPKTKPKACNYGLSLAKGEYLVIYDAEDKPDPLQLKKAYLGFLALGPKVFCLQSKLNYYNPHQNFLTRLFTAEYSLWFDLTLPGLQSVGATIPLGGTSNHFRTDDLKKLEGWDPFNVTEDCDLGVRLFREGYKTAIIDSTTYEEANSNVKNWIRQRSRWIKGYLQTYLVHTREPFKLIKQNGIHAFIFQLVIGMRVAFILINPFLWISTIAYFVLHKYVGDLIASLYPTPVLYIAVISLILGNFVSFYSYMIGCAKRGHWSLVKFMFLVPVYWIFTSIAAYIAFFQLIFKPHYWEKTKHGLHLKTNQEVKEFNKAGLISGGVLVMGTIGANFFNFLYNTYLGRVLPAAEFGTIALIGGILYIAQIFINATSRTLTYKSGFLLGKYGTNIKSYWRKMRTRVGVVSLFVSLLWILITPFLMNIFHTDSVIPFLLFTPVWVVGLIGAVDSGFLSGNLFFASLGITSLLLTIFKFLFAWVLLKMGEPTLVYASIPLAMLIAFLINWFVISKMKTNEKIVVEKNHIDFPLGFFIASLLTNISTIAFLSLDVILAKAYLTPLQAGHYAILSLTGLMVYFSGTLFSQFLVPIVSRREGLGNNSRGIFYKLLAVTILASIVSFLVFGIFGEVSLPILFGNKALEIVPFLPRYCFSMILFSISLSIVSYHQLKKQYIFSFFSFILAIVELVVFHYFHDSLATFVDVMLVMGIINLTFSLSLHFTYKLFIGIGRNLNHLFGLFAEFKFKSKENGLRILIFNWRDTRHVWAGGAEVYLEEIAKRWIKTGNSVTIFCGNDGKSKRFEEIDGIRIIRVGGFYTVYFWAAIYYLLKLRSNFDLVIDSENGIPFFTPLYVRKPIVAIIYHVHQEVFRNNLNFFFGSFARFLEARLMPAIYKSTKESMQIIKIGSSKGIDIIFPGVNLQDLKTTTKTDYPSILYLGRLKPYKSIDILIKAMPNILEKNKNAKLIIAGFGESRNFLETLVKKMRLEEHVEFLGKVTEELKVKLMGSSWVFCQPSSIEGWGMAVIEANACGTPVVASNVSGLRDSVQNPHTGYLVEYGNYEAFAEKINLLITNEALRKQMGKDSIEWAKNFEWKNSADKWLDIIRKELPSKN